ncbi:cryptochrome/photolyase family protein [Muriicola soli]|uniref:Deoxyribodipyrimidine photo-lyase n=1 Tax=Muriicola soli TaxID=2507538 RepID=A0A411E8S1_9FLAO|nr:deoxyribodipyrimidine photo-lyase [Muriicola soli]QBA63933.1 deoxyribodipyrimidine photo-lyase [Muriicola soli]
MAEVAVFWFRRDLRLEDNTGLIHALKGDFPVLPVFIFDPQILGELPEDDARLNFIHDRLNSLRDRLQNNFGSSIAFYHDEPLDVFKKLNKDFDLKGVYCNRDYEPYATERDGKINDYLKSVDIDFHTFKDQVIFEKDEVVKDDGDPYVVYTPFMKTWKEHFKEVKPLQDGKDDLQGKNFYQNKELPFLSLQDMGFKESDIKVPDYDVSPSLIEDYEKTRNFPAKDATSHLGPHLRFGTVSVREMVRKAKAEKNETFLNELIWREFFMQILWHFPRTTNEAFRKKYDRIPWRNNEDEFEKWKNGKTGYALVDAGMRQLNATGYMHNRVRMLVASFLCKHLLIDWRWGEAYFAEKLLDYELSSNVGNWQWAAGSGVDAAPYFRIFNPMTQIDKFDKDRKYIKEWVPEVDTDDYVPKMVDHKEARERCLDTYKSALS